MLFSVDAMGNAGHDNVYRRHSVVMDTAAECELVRIAFFFGVDPVRIPVVLLHHVRLCICIVFGPLRAWRTAALSTKFSLSLSRARSHSLTLSAVSSPARLGPSISEFISQLCRVSVPRFFGKWICCPCSESPIRHDSQLQHQASTPHSTDPSHSPLHLNAKNGDCPKMLAESFDGGGASTGTAEQHLGGNATRAANASLCTTNASCLCPITTTTICSPHHHRDDPIGDTFSTVVSRLLYASWPMLLVYLATVGVDLASYLLFRSFPITPAYLAACKGTQIFDYICSASMPTSRVRVL